MLPLFSLKVSYVRPRLLCSIFMVGKLKAVLMALVNPPPMNLVTLFVSWAGSGLDIWYTTSKISEWQIKDLVLRAMIMAHSSNKANIIKHMISPIPLRSLPLPSEFSITPDMETQI